MTFESRLRAIFAGLDDEADPESDLMHVDMALQEFKDRQNQRATDPTNRAMWRAEIAAVAKEIGWKIGDPHFGDEDYRGQTVMMTVIDGVPVRAHKVVAGNWLVQAGAGGFIASQTVPADDHLAIPLIAPSLAAEYKQNNPDSRPWTRPVMDPKYVVKDDPYG